MAHIDQATTVRPGEELNVTALTAYLEATAPQLIPLGTISQFPGGYSNLTYLLDTPAGEYVLRRPPFGANIQSGHDMGREFKVLQLLRPVYGKAPAPLLFCENTTVLGAPFYIMERVAGIILRGQHIKALSPSPAQVQVVCKALIDNMVHLHSLDIFDSNLVQLGKPEGYIQRQVSGWVDRYYKAATDTISTMDAVAEWMKVNQPDDGAPALIHNDYKYDNIIFDPHNWGQIKAVLDWEMATVGDPLMDVGTTLAYWAEAKEAQALPLAASNPTWLPGNFTRLEFVDYYAQKSGRDLSNILFFYVFGAFKIGVIVQQIYARYKKGLTQDPRFAGLIDAVHFFGQRATTAIERGHIGA